MIRQTIEMEQECALQETGTVKMAALHQAPYRSMSREIEVMTIVSLYYLLCHSHVCARALADRVREASEEEVEGKKSLASSMASLVPARSPSTLIKKA